MVRRVLSAAVGVIVGLADDTKVTAGTTYYYVVTAPNANGESIWSNEVVVTPF